MSDFYRAVFSGRDYGSVWERRFPDGTGEVVLPGEGRWAGGSDSRPSPRHVAHHYTTSSAVNDRWGTLDSGSVTATFRGLGHRRYALDHAALLNRERTPHRDEKEPKA